MTFLSTVLSGRLLALATVLVVAIGAGTAIALASAGPSPVPSPKPLATAVHNALTAPAVTGISADISLTNNLVGSPGSPNTLTSDPLLSGASGHLWLAGGNGLRLELHSAFGNALVVVHNGSFWISDPLSHNVYEGSLPADHTSATDRLSASHVVPTLAQIQSDLSELVGRVNMSGAIPGEVAGQPAYTVRVAATQHGGLLGSAELAWDAVHGVPLRIAIYARNESAPALELKATHISYGPVAASVFNLSPPDDWNVVKLPTAEGAQQMSSTSKLGKFARGADARGVGAVASKLPFKLVAPISLVDLPRHTAAQVDWAGGPPALVTYGQALGGIAVIERPARNVSASSHGALGAFGPVALGARTLLIHGAPGQELDTPLGTTVSLRAA